MNKTLLSGNLVSDPESRTSNAGKAITNFRLAVSGRNDKTVFVDVTTFDKTAELVAKYKVKGDPVLIEGRLELDTWEDRETKQKRSKLYVIADNVEFLSGGKGKSEDGPSPKATYSNKKSGPIQEPEIDQDAPF